MKEFTKVMKALSDPNRVKIVKMLQHRQPLCVCELTAALGLAQPTVSKHLKVLEDADLARSSRDGAWVNYHLAAAPPGSHAKAMLDHLCASLDADPAVADVLLRVAGISREALCAKPLAQQPANAAAPVQEP